MKAVVCEMCNSQDLVKKDGMYICQHCGTKYAPEEAKKLMIDVKVDKTDSIEKWYQLARLAKDSNDAEQAAKYYELVLQEKPNDWESYFFSTYFRAMQTKNDSIDKRAKLVENCLPQLYISVNYLILIRKKGRDRGILSYKETSHSV